MTMQIIGVLATTGVSAIYAVSRAWVKATNEDAKPGYKSTEFWTTVFTAGLGVLAALGIVK